VTIAQALHGIGKNNNTQTHRNRPVIHTHVKPKQNIQHHIYPIM